MGFFTSVPWSRTKNVIQPMCFGDSFSTSFIKPLEIVCKTNFHYIKCSCQSLNTTFEYEIWCPTRQSLHLLKGLLRKDSRWAGFFEPGWLVFIGDEILPCYIGITISQYKVLYQPTSMSRGFWSLLRWNPQVLSPFFVGRYHCHRHHHQVSLHPCSSARLSFNKLKVVKHIMLATYG